MQNENVDELNSKKQAKSSQIENLLKKNQELDKKLQVNSKKIDNKRNSFY